MHIEQFMEVPDAVEYLQEMLEQSENDAVRRMIRIRLLELNAAQISKKEYGPNCDI